MSEWHRVDAAETWALARRRADSHHDQSERHDASAHHLGSALAAGWRPQLVVPTGHWQTATNLRAWTLVGCTVAPGFRFEGFELAPQGWRPFPRS